MGKGAGRRHHRSLCPQAPLLMTSIHATKLKANHFQNEMSNKQGLVSQSDRLCGLYDASGLEFPQSAWTLR